MITTTYKHIRPVNKIGINVCCLYLPVTVINKARLYFLITEANDNAMYMGFQRSLTVPAECPIGEVYSYAVVKELLP